MITIYERQHETIRLKLDFCVTQILADSMVVGSIKFITTFFKMFFNSMCRVIRHFCYCIIWASKHNSLETGWKNFDLETY